jgi:hypothetical protein
MNIFNVISELEKFSNEIFSVNEAIGEEEIIGFETRYNLKLPEDYKILIRNYNGISLYGTQAYGIKEKNGVFSLEECYLSEHYEVENEMPFYLVSFSPDGGGNHYCFDTRFNDSKSCPIVFWQHDISYSDENLPEVVNPSLADWIKEVMIDWTLEDYDYDGTEK